MKKTYLIELLIMIVLQSCSSNLNNIYSLKYDSELPTFKEYHIFNFKDNNDSLIYIISRYENDNIVGLDSLIENNYYDIQLAEAPNKLYMKTAIRGHKMSFIGNDGRLVVQDDTLVGKVYTSPNIIDNYYKKSVSP